MLQRFSALLAGGRGALCAPAVLLAVALLLPGASSVSAQQRPQFRAAVDVIQIQVVVEDNGSFVGGLGAADFSLRVNGSERGITTAYEVDLGDDTAVATADAAPPPAAWRQWVLFFDAGFNSPRGVRNAQEAAYDFVQNQIHERDLVGVASYTPVSGVRLVVPLTTDRSQVYDAIAGLGLRSAVDNVAPAGVIAATMREGFLPDPSFGSTIPGPGGQAAAFDIEEAVNEYITNINRLEIQEYTAVAAQYTEQLGMTLADILSTIRGRKHVIYFSRGYADQVITGASLDELGGMADAMQENVGEAIANAGDADRFGSTDVRDALSEATDSLSAADTVIHVVDPTGVGGERDTGLAAGGRGAGTFGETGDRRSALSALADATDGTMTWNTNDLSAALADLEESTRRYYVLAFPREDGDAGILDLDIGVNRGEVVSAPDRLASPVHYADMSPIMRQAQLAEYISKDIDEQDLSVDVTVAPFAGQETIARMAVVVELPWSDLEALAEEGDDDRIELELYTYAINQYGTIVDLATRPIGLNFDRMKGSNADGLPFRYYDMLWALPGEYRVRTIVRDTEVGRISSRTVNVEVPRHEGGSLAVVGPVPIDWEHPGLIMRGLDPNDPPEHKAGGPLAYPFTVGDIELTPMAAATAKPGGVVQFYFAVYNLTRNPFGQVAAPGMAVDFKDPAGNSINLARVGLIQEGTDAAGGKLTLLGAELPAGLQSGYYSLTVIITDQTSNNQVSGTMPVWVSTD